MIPNESIMQRAVAESLKARITAPPNPWVGCVIVNQGEIVGEGHTQAPGSPHAEIMALQHAKDKAKGSTVYVTLEPCSHQGRTPPCTEALINAGVKSVVIGLQDPDPQVSGKGITRLRSAGIEVATGVCAAQVADTLAPYLYQRKTGRPYCLGKAAISLDGRIAASDGTSQWISSPEARRESHRLRAESQAIVVGARTACRDNPQLTVRNVNEHPATPPLRIVLDAKGVVPPTGHLFNLNLGPTLIVTTQECPQQVKEGWERHGVEVWSLALDLKGRGVDLEQFLDRLGKRGVLQVLVEGGGVLFSSFFDAQLFQSFSLDIGALLLGNKGIPFVELDKISTLAEAVKMRFSDVKMLGNTVRVILKP